MKARIPNFAQLAANGQLALLILLFTVINFNGKLLKVIKDPIILTAPDANVLIIPTIKIWCLLPISLLVILGCQRLLKRYTLSQLFYGTTLAFMSFFMFFEYCLYPALSALVPEQLVGVLSNLLPESSHVFVTMIAYWPLTLFYVVAELWPTLMLTFVFWAYISTQLNQNQARHLYALFSLDAAGILVGTVVYALENLFPYTVGGAWDEYRQTLIVLFLGTAILQVLFFKTYQTRFGISESKLSDEADDTSASTNESEHAPKEVSSIRSASNWVRLKNNGVLRWVAISVFCYEFIEHALELLWKDQVLAYYVEPMAISQVMGKVTFLTGIVGTLTVLFVSRPLLIRRQWIDLTVIAPTICLLFGVAFGISLYSPDWWGEALTAAGISPMLVPVVIGAAMHVALQVLKYTFIDNTKELALLDLSLSDRIVGKGMADAMASRVGKVSSAIVQQSVVMMMGSLVVAKTLLMAMVLITNVTWLRVKPNRQTSNNQTNRTTQKVSTAKVVRT